MGGSLLAPAHSDALAGWHIHLWKVVFLPHGLVTVCYTTFALQMWSVPRIVISGARWCQSMWPPMKPTKEQEPIVTARHGTNANDAHEIFEHVVHSMVQSRAHTLAAGRQLVGQPMTQPHRTSACVWFSDLPPGLLSEVDRSEWSCVLLRRWCPSMMSQRPLPLPFHWRGSPLPSWPPRLQARGGQRPPTGTAQPTTGLD